MIRIGILGSIGSGKSYIAKKFGYPVFNADLAVAKIYKENRKCFKKLKRCLPKYINSFPIEKKQILDAILANNSNLKKIIKIIHPEVRLQMKKFIKKNKNKKIIVLDIPLLLENGINKKADVLVYIDANPKKLKKMLVKRRSFNKKITKRFKNLQLPLEYKKKKSHFVIKNNFKSQSFKKDVNRILKNIFSYERNSP